MSFVYGLGVTNNFAMIGFFPCVLVAVLWIKGRTFFDFQFVVRMVIAGLLGLSLYLLLPLVWAFSDNPTVGFWQALRAHLASQKALLFNAPLLRSRVLILSLTSVLPVLLAGVRWPASFGDTSAAGAALSSLMFRVVHTVFLAACIWVAFDQQFSPRSLGLGRPFLPFYYLGALAIGYFSGYLLLVFGEGRSKSWHRKSPLQLLFNRLVVAAVWLALFAVPAGLVAKNWNSIRTTNGPLLQHYAEQSAANLPPKGGIVLSDDAYGLLLLSAGLGPDGGRHKYALVHTRSLLSPDYHQELHKHYPDVWPNVFTNQPPDEVIDDGSLLQLITYLSLSNSLCYLHPSFGYYFERFYLRPQGVVYHLNICPTNSIFPPNLNTNDLATNQKFWDDLSDPLKQLANNRKIDSRDAHYLARYYSRALNYWGVALQRANTQPSAPAGRVFQLAYDLNTNNVPAQSNLQFNRSLCTGKPHVPETAKSLDEKLGIYRGWEPMLIENGPFDHPDFCMRLGQMFASQNLYRQAALQYDRVRTLERTNLLASLALADVYLRAGLANDVLNEVGRVRSEQKLDALPPEFDLELARLEASAQFARHNTNEAEKILRAGFAKYPKYPGILDTLVQLYIQTDRLPDAFSTAQAIINADPDRVQSYINQAALYYRTKDTAKALQSIDQILQKSPQQPQALLYKIFLLLETKDYAKARTAIDTLLTVEPENGEALLYKGVVEIETKQFAKAIEPLSRLLERQPNNANGLRNRGVAYLELGELAKAEKDYNTMRRLVSRDYVYVAYYGLGEIAFKRNDADAARKYYNLYLQFAPNTDSPELRDEKRLVTDRLQGLKQAKR
jgi:tetratricopeptide (TPR) repeat protein